MSVESHIDGTDSLLSDAQQDLDNFWPKVTEDIKTLTQVGL